MPIATSTKTSRHASGGAQGGTGSNPDPPPGSGHAPNPRKRPHPSSTATTESLTASAAMGLMNRRSPIQRMGVASQVGVPLGAGPQITIPGARPRSRYSSVGI